MLKYCADENALMRIAANLAKKIEEGAIIFLQGPLGAGKTTFVRGFLQSLGYKDAVKSPTYTLVESYALENKMIYHFDFYRIQDSAELDFIGLQDYFHPAAICLIEWPELGKGKLPTPDISCYIEPVSNGRQLTLKAYTARGEQWMNNENDF